MPARVMKEFQAPRGLPRKTASVCPECIKVIPAIVREKEGRVIMEKTCRTHGYFWDIISNDVDFYLRMEVYAHDGVGYENPYYDKFRGCPTTCGMCSHHKSHTGLALVDLTNRCNLKCPVCFANANAAGYVFEPSREQIHFMLKTLREQKPVGTVAVQFSGGEPTLSPLFLDAVSMARDLGFKQVQVATNGIRFANEPGFAQACRDAGLHTLYLQFDGLDDEIYRKVRGVPLFKMKQKAIQAARETHSSAAELAAGKPDKPVSVVLVPTLVGGFNEKEIWPTVKFAIDNLDVVRGVNFQPVALTARIPDKDRFQMRFTQSDLVRILCTEGPFEKSDFFPVPSVAPISELVSIIHGEEKMTLTTHPGCGCTTFAFVSKDGEKITPLPRFMDVDGFFENVESMIEKYRDARFARVRTAVAGARLLHRRGEVLRLLEGARGAQPEELRPGHRRDLHRGEQGSPREVHVAHALHREHALPGRVRLRYPAPDALRYPLRRYRTGASSRSVRTTRARLPDGGRAEVLDLDRRLAGGEDRAGTGLKTIETMGVNGEVMIDPRSLQTTGAEGRPGCDLATPLSPGEPFPSPFFLVVLSRGARTARHRRGAIVGSPERVPSSTGDARGRLPSRPPRSGARSDPVGGAGQRPGLDEPAVIGLDVLARPEAAREKSVHVHGAERAEGSWEERTRVHGW